MKSMAGERLDVADMGWHGIDGDRRFCTAPHAGSNALPWLSASTLPELLLFSPLRHEADVEGDLPTHVRTPEDKEMTF